MKVELLYTDGCSHWQLTLEELTSVLKEHQVDVQVESIKVTSQQQAERLEFLGSPTVRIDGMDTDADMSGTEYTVEPRVYLGEDGEETGRPPKEWLAAAVEASLE